MKTLRLSLITCGCLTASIANAAIVLTEVDFATDTIELTNIGDTNFSGTRLDWCVPFSYGSLQLGGFTFTPGESRTYTIGFNLDAASGDDLWIYLDRGPSFGNESEVTTGVVWGSNQAGSGRVNAVVAESDAWDVAADFVTTGSIGAGQTIQLAPGSPPASTSPSWIIADANLGSYAPKIELSLTIKPGPGANQVTVLWPTSTPDTAVLESTPALTTNGWTPLAGNPSTNGSNLELVLPAVGAEFFRLAN